MSVESSIGRVLIIGGNGLLGSALLDLLLKGHGNPTQISVLDIQEL